MLEILSITIPFFAIIFCGSLARIRGWFSEDSGRVLARYAFLVVLPPFMFLAITSIDVKALFHLGFVVRYEFVTISMFIIAAFFATYVIRLTPQQRGLFCLNTAYPNYGYIGIPLSLAAFGQDAALPLAFILLADTIVLLTSSSLFIALSEQKKSFSELFYNLIRRIISQPLLIAVCLGMLFSQLAVSMTPIIDDFLMNVGGAAAPVALIALGASITLKFPKSQTLELIIITIGKLILHPVLISFVYIMWPSEKTVWFQTAILCASLPVAANVFVLAGYYGVFKKESANAIVLTTIISTVTVPLTLYIILNI